MRELTTIAKVLLFTISYSPLAVIYLISDFDRKQRFCFDNPLLSWFIVFACVLAVPVLLGFVRHYREKGKAGNEVDRVAVSKVKPLDQEVLSYIVTYMLPFLQMPSQNREVIIIFLFLIIFFLYVNSNMIGINPVLNLLGYSIFEVEDVESFRRVIVAPTHERSKLLRAKVIRVVDICGELEFLVEVVNAD